VSMTNSTFGFVSGNSVAQCAAHSEHPPVGGSVKFKNCFMSLPRKRGKIGFWLSGCPRPLGDVASFGMTPLLESRGETMEPSYHFLVASPRS